MATRDDEQREAERLRSDQTQRARTERHAADQAAEPEEALVHDRRAERAAYLAKRLAERERSESESEGP